jgi:hypothetical protein
MKILIDVDKLLQDGRITGAEYARLKALAVKETGSLALNILIGFGVVATAGGALALVPSPATAILGGLALAAAGILLPLGVREKWDLLGSILLLVGSIASAGGVLFATHGGPVGFLVVTALCMVAAALAKSSLLAVMSVLSLAATIGAATAYGHATYMLAIRQPTLTVCLFSLLALGAYHLSAAMQSDYQRLAIVVARASLFVVNMGFWVGSLWGDSLWRQRDFWDFRGGELVPAWVFVVGWAAALLATGLWAARNNKRWVVNLLAVFGAIHFYTQYFERLGREPASVLFAGLVALGIALAVAWYNRSALGPTSQVAVPLAAMVPGAPAAGQPAKPARSEQGGGGGP